ncbi:MULTISPECIES: hypothetical protein [Sulfurimonas]|uniref:hypothetical protein n=1 Tax=Sulfurimonas TaxID=202746 RepID=UPI001264EFAB|nr:hypothetical protein [Sulfurimonas indica]
MKKIIILSVTVLLSSLLFVSCSATTGAHVDAKTADYTYFKEMPLQKVHKLIVEAGEDDGWRMTEFKENELIAEKTENGETKAVTVEFSKDYFHVTPHNGDLEDAIEDKLGL